MKLAAFLERDVRIAASYRLPLLLSAGQTAVAVLLFFFIGRTFDVSLSPFLQRYGGDYFAYVLVGIAVSLFVSVGLDSFSRQVRDAQLQGTLEALLSTPTPVGMILIGNSLFPFLAAAASAAGVLACGALFLGLRVGAAGALTACLVLLLTFCAFLSIGMVSASFVMVFKQGSPVGLLFGTASYFLGGVVFPVEVLPAPLQAASRLLPTTWAVKSLRELFLARAGLSEVLPLALNLLVFIAVAAPLGLLLFRAAVERARRDGTLLHY